MKNGFFEPGEIKYLTDIAIKYNDLLKRFRELKEKILADSNSSKFIKPNELHMKKHKKFWEDF